MMVKRVYFGNWLRDYSQALDVGTLKGVQSGTLRILVWVLSFLSFGYATGEFEVTDERLGVYRPEEHIDNPKDYADGLDARQYDPRLRPPVQPVELQIDPDTGMKNYIANERGGWATSASYVKQSFSRSIHFGRQYTSSSGMFAKGKEEDLCEALRCLGQALHCLEDFGAHTNYTELALRELGFGGVFPHTGVATEINLRGHRVFPLVTGSFGVVDFLHSVLGEATDHFAQTEVEQLDSALGNAQVQSKRAVGSQGYAAPAQSASYLTSLLSKVPGAGELCRQAEHLQAQADAQEHSNQSGHGSGNSRAVGEYHDAGYSSQPAFAAPPGAPGGPPGPGIPGMSPNFDPAKTVAQIYPILEFRDKVVRAISSTIEKIPGLEALVEKITETLTLFILSLLAPFIRPIIAAVSAQLKAGSSSVVDASGKHQYEVWTDPHCSDPTHSLLSKDHFSNILNEPAGQVAAAILQYVAPRIIHAWEHPDIPVQQILDDVARVFHHPAIRDPHCELHRNMFDVVQRWVNSRPDRGASLNVILGSDGVRQGKNHQADLNQGQGHSHGGLPNVGNFFGSSSSSHSKVGGGAPWEKLLKIKDMTGSRRDDIGDAADALSGAYPGTETQYDITRLSTEYQPHPETLPQQQQQQYPYAHQQQPPYPSEPLHPNPPFNPNPYANQEQIPYQGQQTYQHPYDQPAQYPPPHHQQAYHNQGQYQNPPYPDDSSSYPAQQGQGYAQEQGYPGAQHSYAHDPSAAPPQQGQYGYGAGYGGQAPQGQGQGSGGGYWDGRGY